MNLVSMISDVALNQIRRDFVPHGPRKIPVLPELSSPQLFSHFWKFLKDLTRRNTLQHTYYSCNRISCGEAQEHVNMIRCYTHLLNFKTVMICNLQKYLFCLIPDIFSLNPSPILGCPHQVIFRILNSMSSSSDTHEVSYSTFFCFQQTHLSSPSTERGFQVRF
jgi:hypothetical protein